MQWVVTTGRTVEEAKEAALDELGIDEDEAEFEILEEPKAGLFGRVRSEARVRARVKPRAPRSKDRRERRRRPARENRRTDQARSEGTPVDAAADDNIDDDAGADDDVDEGEKMTEEGAREVSMAEQGEVATDFLTGLVAEFGVRGATVAVREIDEDTIEVGVQGDDLGLLIGPKGQTLEAVQELVRTTVQRQTGARHGRILVDVAGYRQRRREALERFTRQLAEEVRSSGMRKLLEPMSASDRKVVHDTANTIDGVTTVSEGEEPRRRVVLLPANPSQSGD